MYFVGDQRPQAPFLPRGLFFFRRFGDHRQVDVATGVESTTARSLVDDPAHGVTVVHLTGIAVAYNRLAVDTDRGAAFDRLDNPFVRPGFDPPAVPASSPVTWEILLWSWQKTGCPPNRVSGLVARLSLRSAWIM